MRLPTIRIKQDTERGSAIINLSDFDPALHEPFDDVEAAKVGHAGVSEGSFKPLEGFSGEEKTSEPLSDDELRKAIEEATGKAPHHRTGRAKLLSQYEELSK